MSAKKKTITIEVTQAQLDALNSLIAYYAESHLADDHGRSTPRSRGVINAADRLYRELTKKAQPRRRPAD